MPESIYSNLVIQSKISLYGLILRLVFSINHVVEANKLSFTYSAIPANTGHSPNAVSMLGQRRRRWTNIETALDECACWESAILFLQVQQTMCEIYYSQ